MRAQSTQSWIDTPPLDEPRAVWQKRIAGIRPEDGFYKALGDEHSALYVKRGQTLVVSFETLIDVYRHGENRLPWGLGKDQPPDWSVLGVMALAPTWFRDRSVYDFFDQLKNDGFFEQFDQVIFYGAGMGAYAACVFSAIAPGATVVAIGPQATLERDLVPWESRFRPAWRRDFSSPNGYAPDMLEAAERVFLFYDPVSPPDAMHAVLFQGENVTKFKCRYMGQDIVTYWREMQIHNAVVERCIDHNLPPAAFYRMLRKRHDSSRFQKEILARLAAREKHALLVQYCSAVLDRRRAPTFRKEMNRALEILGQTQ